MGTNSDTRVLEVKAAPNTIETAVNAAGATVEAAGATVEAAGAAETAKEPTAAATKARKVVECVVVKTIRTKRNLMRKGKVCV